MLRARVHDELAGLVHIRLGVAPFGREGDLRDVLHRRGLRRAPAVAIHLAIQAQPRIKTGKPRIGRVRNGGPVRRPGRVCQGLIQTRIRVRVTRGVCHRIARLAHAAWWRQRGGLGRRRRVFVQPAGAAGDQQQGGQSDESTGKRCASRHFNSLLLNAKTSTGRPDRCAPAARPLSDDFPDQLH